MVAIAPSLGQGSRLRPLTIYLNFLLCCRLSHSRFVYFLVTLQYTPNCHLGDWPPWMLLAQSLRLVSAEGLVRLPSGDWAFQVAAQLVPAGVF